MELLVKLGLIAFLAFPAAGQKTNVVRDTIFDSNAVRNFKLSLQFARTTFTNGEPVMCLSGLTNFSDIPTIVFPSYIGANLQLFVTNASGDQIPYSHLFRSSGPVVGGELVPPHSVERCYFAFPLNDHFQLPPGIYRVSAVRDIRYPLSDTTLTSSVVTIKIVEPPVSNATNAPPPRR
jgi:hypothetical protein